MRLSVYPKMAFISPHVDLKTDTLTVSAPGRESLKIDLGNARHESSATSVVKVCGNKCGASLWGDFRVSEWFSEYLGVQCWLARHSGGAYQLPSNAGVPRSPFIAFANEQPLLLISEHAVDALNTVLTQQNQRTVSTRHFRPNMVVRVMGQSTNVNNQQHTEDGWKSVLVSEKNLDLAVVGQCARCSMVDVDPSSGMKGKTLRALAHYRRANGQIVFGIFLRANDGGEDAERSLRDEMSWFEEGDRLICD